MKNLRNKRVEKLRVGDLKKALEKADDDMEVVLAFYMKDKGIHFGYLAEVFTEMKFDSVAKTKLSDNSVVELGCFDDQFCTYIEKKGD